MKTLKFCLCLLLLSSSLPAQKKIAIDNQTDGDLTHMYPQQLMDAVWWTESGNFSIEEVADLLQEDELLRQGEGIVLRIEREGCEFTLLARGKNTKAYMVEFDPCKPDAKIVINESNCVNRCNYVPADDVTPTGEKLTKIEFANQIEAGLNLTALYIVSDLSEIRFQNSQVQSTTKNYLKMPLAYDSVATVRPTLTNCSAHFIANGSNGKVYMRKYMDLCSDLSGVYFGGLEEVNANQPDGYSDETGGKWFGSKAFTVVNQGTEDITKLFVLAKDGTSPEEPVDVLSHYKLIRAEQSETLVLLFPTEEAILHVVFYDGTERKIKVPFSQKTIEIK